MKDAIKKLLEFIDRRLPWWIPADKFKHAIICMIPPIFASWYGLSFSLGIALGKEAGDYFNPLSKWCWKDLIADGVGIVTGMVVNLMILKPLVKHIAVLVGIA